MPAELVSVMLLGCCRHRCLVNQLSCAVCCFLLSSYSSFSFPFAAPPDRLNDSSSAESLRILTYNSPLKFLFSDVDLKAGNYGCNTVFKGTCNTVAIILQSLSTVVSCNLLKWNHFRTQPGKFNKILVSWSIFSVPDTKLTIRLCGPH